MSGQSQGVMEDVSEMLKVVVGCTDGNKLMERNNAFKLMVMALKEETMATIRVLNTKIEELKGELTLYRTIMDRRVSSVTLNIKVDVLKPKECAGA
ncbi:hypothetical protein Golob_014676 [Gossypium lobatum]|uniref:Uncharacterized protein n=1 Tax=Gossypium lobatum TaxID=34289 RepID=A0A7J8LZ08_9ROSI|nr:hypothetical protein [Gossypium lobatum]